MEEWEESPVANGPMKSSYSPGIEQIGNLIQKIGPELYLALERGVEDPDYKRKWIEGIMRGNDRNTNNHNRL